MKNTVRKRLLPLMPCVRALATAKASTLMNTSETSAKSAVYQNEWTKLASFSALMELPKPMNCASEVVLNLQNERYTPLQNG